MYSLISKDNRFCPVDGVTYLGIRKEKYKVVYFTSTKPQCIPQGFQVDPVKTELEPVGRCRGRGRGRGLRLFKVYEEGAKLYDVVYVGTLDVVNRTAWIVGEAICWEEPYAGLYDQVIKLPPIALTYPVQKPESLTDDEFLTQLKCQMALKLDYTMSIEGYDTSSFDIVVSCGRESRDIYGEECPKCHFTPEFHFDDICDEFAKKAEANSATEKLSSSLNDLLLAPLNENGGFASMSPLPDTNGGGSRMNLQRSGEKINGNGAEWVLGIKEENVMTMDVEKEELLKRGKGFGSKEISAGHKEEDNLRG